MKQKATMDNMLCYELERMYPHQTTPHFFIRPKLNVQNEFLQLESIKSSLSAIIEEPRFNSQNLAVIMYNMDNISHQIHEVVEQLKFKLDGGELGNFIEKDYPREDERKRLG